MAQKVKDVMTSHPLQLSVDSSVRNAAECMRDENVGAIVLQENGRVCGIVTDRDIAVRAIAEGLNPDSTTLKQIYSGQLVTVSPDDDADRAIALMRQEAVRRIPVVENGSAVGILSLGDLAVERDRKSVLGQISAAPPNL